MWGKCRHYFKLIHKNLNLFMMDLYLRGHFLLSKSRDFKCAISNLFMLLTLYHRYLQMSPAQPIFQIIHPSPPLDHPILFNKTDITPTSPNQCSLTPLCLSVCHLFSITTCKFSNDFLGHQTLKGCNSVSLYTWQSAMSF